MRTLNEYQFTSLNGNQVLAFINEEGSLMLKALSSGKVIDYFMNGGASIASEEDKVVLNAMMKAADKDHRTLVLFDSEEEAENAGYGFGQSFYVGSSLAAYKYAK